MVYLGTSKKKTRFVNKLPEGDHYYKDQVSSFVLRVFKYLTRVKEFLRFQDFNFQIGVFKLCGVCELTSI